MRLQRGHNKLRDGEDIEVRQAKRYRTHDNNDDDGNIVMMVVLMVMIMMISEISYIYQKYQMISYNIMLTISEENSIRSSPFLLRKSPRVSHNMS